MSPRSIRSWSTSVFRKYELAGPLNNIYYKKEVWNSRPQPSRPLLFTCRIDGPSYEICERIIEDSLAVEETGSVGLSAISTKPLKE